MVLFRSLRDAPSYEALLESYLSVLAPESLALGSQSQEHRLSQLLLELRSRRVLLVLDNLEVLLEAGEVLGRLRPGFEAYEPLLRQVAQTAHQSCLLLASGSIDGSVKLWDVESRAPLWSGWQTYERLDITGIRGLTQAQKATLRALGAVEKRGGLLKE